MLALILFRINVRLRVWCWPVQRGEGSVLTVPLTATDLFMSTSPAVWTTSLRNNRKHRMSHRMGRNSRETRWEARMRSEVTHRWAASSTRCPESPEKAPSPAVSWAWPLRDWLDSSFLVLCRSASAHRRWGLGSSLRKDLQWGRQKERGNYQEHMMDRAGFSNL